MTETVVTQPAAQAAATRSLFRRAIGGTAIALAGAGIVSLLAFAHPHTATPALLYLVVVLAATASGGLAPGLLAAAISFVLFTYLFLPPRHSFGFSGDGIFALVSFVVAALFGSSLIVRQRASQRRSEQALDNAQRLQRVAEALATALTPQEVLDATLGVGVAAAEARAGLIAMLSEDGEWLEVLASTGYDLRWIDPFRRFPVAGNFPLSEAVRTGEGVFVHSERERDERYPELVNRSQPGHGLACLPLVVERGVIGGIVFSFSTDQEFPQERRALKAALARQAAVALERARLLQTERDLRGRLAFLGEATAILASSLDYERTLSRLVELAVPTLGDWCALDMLASDGRIERIVVAHQDPERRRWAEEMQARSQPRIEDETGVARVIREGEPQFMAEIPRDLLEQAAQADPETAEIVARTDLRSWIAVPLTVGAETLGALTLVTEGERTLTQEDFELALQLAERAAVAVDNARLYREAELRADAALALEYVGDGVVLLDHGGRIRYWNTAISAITGLDEADAIGRRANEALPGWEQLAGQVTLAAADAPERARPVTVPFAAPDGERWLAIAGVAFDAGAVYAVRDVSEEQALERARNDFVATASHELRTPLAAVYGAARTLRRPDLDLLPEQRSTFLEIIESETERLTAIVSQILLAGQLDGGRVDVSPSETDLQALAESVVASARVRAPEKVQLRLEGDEPVRAIADEDKLRQVLVNLVDNAVKYSPDGGEVVVELRRGDGRARIAVRDRGLGIPQAEQARIFEKFYRLDPQQTRGVGGSGLGLYISRELVQRMGGRIGVDSEPGRGSTFSIELPAPG
ncbi:MAG: GAF domain-containing protein [Actinobacteria bacterium]|nr:GAF domain-containing protein [Actinomycetota bacterium]